MIFNVPYMAMPSELADDYRRAHADDVVARHLHRHRHAGRCLGAARVAELFGEGPEGYARMGVFYGVVIFAFMAASFFATSGGKARPRDQQRVSFGEQLRTAFANKPFMALLG